MSENPSRDQVDATANDLLNVSSHQLKVEVPNVDTRQRWATLAREAATALADASNLAAGMRVDASGAKWPFEKSAGGTASMINDSAAAVGASIESVHKAVSNLADRIDASLNKLGQQSGE